MQTLLYLSGSILPLTIAAILVFGLLSHRPLYDDFIVGAKDGIQTVAHILPTIIGLMISVRVLRASGFLDFLQSLLEPAAQFLHFPSQLLPMTLVRIFSTSAANGFLLDIFQVHGPDSYEGILASLIMSSTEAAFYTISIYFTSARILKTRWTIPGAVAATVAGIAASTLITGILF
ncbi:MAG: spore maturation protein [Clostridiales bacterium]|nr:spore maturation protein [Clostridiales bacterium]